jgi:hypothetical protein
MVFGDVEARAFNQLADARAGPFRRRPRETGLTAEAVRLCQVLSDGIEFTLNGGRSFRVA